MWLEDVLVCPAGGGIGAPGGTPTIKSLSREDRHSFLSIRAVESISARQECLAYQSVLLYLRVIIYYDRRLAIAAVTTTPPAW